MFALYKYQRRNKFEEVCIPSNRDLFGRYGQHILFKGSNDGNSFVQPDNAFDGLSKPEKVMKAREIVKSMEPTE